MVDTNGKYSLIKEMVGVGIPVFFEVEDGVKDVIGLEIVYCHEIKIRIDNLIALSERVEEDLIFLRSEVGERLPQAEVPSSKISVDLWIVRGFFQVLVRIHIQEMGLQVQ